MPKSKTRKDRNPHRPTLPGPARRMFAEIGVQYADATEAEWDELRDHLGTRLQTIAGGNQDRRNLLEQELDRVRTHALEVRPARQLRSALADGGATLTRDRGDGLEEWSVVVGGRSLMAYVPTTSAGHRDGAGDRAGDRAGATVLARRALLEGRCPSCRAGATLEHPDTGRFHVEHTARCPAATVFG